VHLWSRVRVGYPLNLERQLQDRVRELERELVTVQEAARRLGMTESAVRKRAQRGQLRSEKAMEGKKERLYIFLDPDEDKFPEPFRERYIRSLEQRVNTLEDEVYRQQAILLNMTEAMKALNPPAPEDSSEERESPESSGPTSGGGEVWEEIDTERARREMAESTLREGMAEEQRRREEAERARDDLRRELYALRDLREPPQTVEEEPERAEPRPDAQSAQESVQRPWWRRWFGG
jgi:hypothetical protein